MSQNNSDENKKIDPITKDPLMDHEYDGIKELDNPLPSWWLFTFYIAIAFSAFYVIHYHLMDGTLIYKEYAKDLMELEMKQAENSKQPLPTLEVLTPYLNDADKKDLGKSVYLQHCLSCHGAQGGGGIGPNLADDYWIHGDGGVVSIAEIVLVGVGDKGMPAWKTVLKQEESLAVSGFVKSLRGTNPVNPKEPQGELKSK